MIDYTIFFKERLAQDELRARRTEWDVVIGAIDGSDRSRSSFEATAANKKVLVAFSEYGFVPAEIPVDAVGTASGVDAIEAAAAVLDPLGDLQDCRLCLDISGFISHHVLAFVRLLAERGVTAFDILYTEPLRYRAKEETKFSDERVLNVRQLAGYEGVHLPDTSHDLLVLLVGYDHALVAEVASAKEDSKKIQVFGLPSLRPDMYQEGILRARRAAEAVGGAASDPHTFRFAPASDPFVTAAVLQKILGEHRTRYPTSNVYLAPLSTKAQALGVAIFYLTECRDTPTSVLYPVCERYERITSEGVSNHWLYTVELPPGPAAALSRPSGMAS
jgi:hypothetical protein